MTSLTVTANGRITLKPELPQHLGVKPGERAQLNKMPDDKLRLQAAHPAGTIESFIGRHAGRTKRPVDRCRDTNVVVRTVRRNDEQQAHVASQLLRQASLIAISLPCAAGWSRSRCCTLRERMQAVPTILTE